MVQIRFQAKISWTTEMLWDIIGDAVKQVQVNNLVSIGGEGLGTTDALLFGHGQMWSSTNQSPQSPDWGGRG